MKKFMLAIVGILFLYAGVILLFRTFILDPVYDFYYRNNHYQFSELKSDDPGATCIIDATIDVINKTNRSGGFRTGIRRNGKLEAACLNYGSFFNVESGTYFYKFENCGQSDFFLRSKEMGPLIGTVKLKLKASESKYYEVFVPQSHKISDTHLKRVTWRLLSSQSPLEFETNHAAGILAMPD